MFDPFHEPDDHWIAYSDYITSLLGYFLFVAVLMILWVNPVAKQAEGVSDPPGQIRVEVSWKEDVDVDLWAKAPGDIIVGYSNKAGKVFNLLRDDLGKEYERFNGIHMENVYSRGTPQGEYIVNVHMFRNERMIYPVKVVVRVTITTDKSRATPDNVVDTTVTLNASGEELTVARFKLDANGKLVPGSMNQTFKALRSDGIRK